MCISIVIVCARYTSTMAFVCEVYVLITFRGVLLFTSCRDYPLVWCVIGIRLCVFLASCVSHRSFAFLKKKTNRKGGSTGRSLATTGVRTGARSGVPGPGPGLGRVGAKARAGSAPGPGRGRGGAWAKATTVSGSGPGRRQDRGRFRGRGAGPGPGRSRTGAGCGQGSGPGRGRHRPGPGPGRGRVGAGAGPNPGVPPRGTPRSPRRAPPGLGGPGAGAGSGPGSGPGPGQARAAPARLPQARPGPTLSATHLYSASGESSRGRPLGGIPRWGPAESGPDPTRVGGYIADSKGPSPRPLQGLREGQARGPQGRRKGVRKGPRARGPQGGGEGPPRRTLRGTLASPSRAFCGRLADVLRAPLRATCVPLAGPWGR